MFAPRYLLIAYHERMNSTATHPDPTLRAAREAALRELPDMEALYAFGSRARGDARVHSDLDLAVLSATALDPLRRFQAQQALSVQLGVDVDLVDLRTASSVLQSEVIHDGKLLFTSDADRTLDFEARVLGDYAELLDATRRLREQVRETGRVYP